MTELLQIIIFTFRALFFTGITFGSFKVGIFSASFIVGSVLTFNQDVLDRKENGLLWCYFCGHQIDPKMKAILHRTLDNKQDIVAFPCDTCRSNNYFPIPPNQKQRALHGGKIYGELRAKLGIGTQHNDLLSKD